MLLTLTNWYQNHFAAAGNMVFPTPHAQQHQEAAPEFTAGPHRKVVRVDYGDLPKRPAAPAQRSLNFRERHPAPHAHGSNIYRWEQVSHL